MRTGILGGTFDPPHIAHLIAAETAYHQLALDRVLMIPAGSPWQKSARKVSAPQHRWQMTKLAVGGVEYFSADDREVLRDGLTYTSDTLATFPPDEQLVLILGADAARGLSTWHRGEEVIARATLAIAPRPGTSRGEVEQAVGAVKWLDMPELPLSGSSIRERYSNGLPVRFLVPDPVWSYLVLNQLYR